MALLRQGLRVTLVEAVDAAGGVDYALLTRGVGVAFAADVGGDIFAGRPGLPRVAARANDRRFDVARVNLFFHWVVLSWVRDGFGCGSVGLLARPATGTRGSSWRQALAATAS